MSCLSKDKGATFEEDIAINYSQDEKNVLFFYFWVSLLWIVNPF